MQGEYSGCRVANNSECRPVQESFREEGREVLVDLEAALLELNEGRGDMELVGRVFRALHTIKGSGAMFGFEDLAAFTHNLESAFDEVRNGRLAIRLGADRSDAFGARSDSRHARRGHAGAVEADPSACAEILAKVRHLTGKPEPQRPEQMAAKKTAGVRDSIALAPQARSGIGRSALLRGRSSC